MRIVSWNCNGAFRKKRSIVSALEADVYVIQECEDPAQCRDAHYKAWATNYLWVGKNKNRGLGIFARADITIEPANLDAGPLEFFLPCVVTNRLALLAAWACEAHSPTFGYIGQLWKYLQLHQEFLWRDKAVLIGDLNSNTRWDKWDRWWNHSDVVKRLQELGLTSLYHQLRTEPQGQEITPTFFLHKSPKKPYHIDYAFLSAALLQGASLEIGNPETWLEHSDHMPLIVNIMVN